MVVDVGSVKHATPLLCLLLLLLLSLLQTNVRISLTATGGCGNPLAPAGIQVGVLSLAGLASLQALLQAHLAPPAVVRLGAQSTCRLGG